jgi:predicted kinase
MSENISADFMRDLRGRVLCQKVIVVMVGLPRSGKSTWVKENQMGRAVVSADDLRYIVYNERFNAEKEDEMWKVRGAALQMLMNYGVNIIIDETNTTKKRRSPIIGMAKIKGYKVVACVVTTSKEICLDRAKALNDDAIIPTIERMAAQYEPVTNDEGFDAIIEVEMI